MADKAQRVADSVSAGIASQAGALARIGSIDAQARKVLDTLKPLKLDAGLLPAQAAAAAHIGTLPYTIGALTTLETSPGFKSLSAVT